MKHALSLFVVLVAGVVCAQEREMKALLYDPALDTSAGCSIATYPDVYFSLASQNIWACVDGEWDLLAPSAADDRTGWYILSDDMNRANELGTQIGDEVTGTGAFVRESGATIDLASVQLTTSGRGGATEGVMTWDSGADTLDITDGSGSLTFYPGEHTGASTALTPTLTTITHTAPSPADYAVQNMTSSGVGAVYGFATQDEANTVLLVVANLQTRVDELETKLTDVGLLLSAENGTMRGVKLQGVKIQL